MLSLNFTVIITMLVFLLFLRITSRAVWRPLIRHMVRRERLFTTHEKAIAQHLQEATQLKARITLQLEKKEKQLVRELDEKTQQAHRSRRTLLTEERNRVEQELINLHEELRHYLAKERLRFADALPGLIETMDRQFHEKGPRL
jgi:F0F1-type ATP synthase membrane subunit b/b'